MFSFFSCIGVRPCAYMCQNASKLLCMQTGSTERTNTNLKQHYPSCFIAIQVPDANIVEPDQTPQSAASDLGWCCLPMSHL